MRIALLSETFLPKIDGIVNTLCYLLAYLDEHGHESILFAPEGGPSKYAKTPVVGLPAFSFPLYPELSLVPPYVNLMAELSAFAPDIVHVLNPVSLGVAGINHARKLDVPVVASYHTDIPGFAVKWGLSALEDTLWAYFRWVHNQADLNLCPSEATMAEVRAHGILHTQVWSRGVDTERFTPKKRSGKWRNLLTDGHTDQPLLLYVGRLSPEKRVDWLQVVLKAIPEARLAIVGDGPARGALERVFENTPTVFTGYLHGDKLAHAYAAADIFTFPAANETFGNVALEAMASGVPVVAPRSGGVLDHVIHGETGLFFDPVDPQAMVQAVQSLLNNRIYRQHLAINARRTAVSRTWNTVFDKLLVDYQRLIEPEKIRQIA